MIELVDCVSRVSLEKEQARVAELDCLMAGACRRHHLRVEREFLVCGGEEFHRICVATGEQNAVVGKQSSGVTDSRRSHGHKHGGKGLRRRIEYFRGASFRDASVVTASDKHFAVVEHRGRMPRARRAHAGSERSEASGSVRGIKNLDGI